MKHRRYKLLQFLLRNPVPLMQGQRLHPPHPAGLHPPRWAIAHARSLPGRFGAVPPQQLAAGLVPLAGAVGQLVPAVAVGALAWAGFHGAKRIRLV